MDEFPNENIISGENIPSIDASEEEAPEIRMRIQNIVATVQLGCRVDLSKIAQTARNAEYNPRRFAAVIMRIREPRTTGIFK